MTALNPETRAVIDAVLEALAIPYAATVGHEETRAKILAERLSLTVVVLETLTKRDVGLAWSLEYLRERLADYPPTGYVTYDQAAEHLAAGASWMEAVRLDDSGDDSGDGDPTEREGGRR
ncbi:hypothetical protein ACFQY7_00075 [Actinomadura luteofluorescens]|uniref:Uncharacterized protein n=1 Tax=Actinomadura luteofluorescens TaxID=46163 RepID=A0A7Y9ED57_9ACTN|nr:hypothetical protein [Actinomadura luteofluorescens]NYD45583.1 hypothetical protein [Actinomadura luteofluorescens]